MNKEWSVSEDGRKIFSDDFTYDVTLKVDGDFEDDAQRKAYTEKLAEKLNRVQPAPEKTTIKRGQVLELKAYGKVRFDRLDYFRGQCTAKLTGIDHPGTYYPFLEHLENEGFTVIDA